MNWLMTSKWPCRIASIIVILYCLKELRKEYPSIRSLLPDITWVFKYIIGAGLLGMGVFTLLCPWWILENKKFFKDVIEQIMTTRAIYR